MSSEDPTAIRSIAVTAADVVAALEANQRRQAGAVLRVTPPFSGRMRARLHLAGAEDEYDDPEPLHIPPERFVESVPPFPVPDDTEDEIRDDPNQVYSPETHRKYHEEAVDTWRESVRRRFRERTVLETVQCDHEVEVTVLGETA